MDASWKTDDGVREARALTPSERTRLLLMMCQVLIDTGPDARGWLIFYMIAEEVLRLIGKRAMPRVFRNSKLNSTPPFHPTSQILTHSSTVEEGAPWIGAWLAIMRGYAEEENEIEDGEWIDYHPVWFQHTLDELKVNASNYIQREARLRVEAYGEELVQGYEFYDNLVDRLRWVYVLVIECECNKQPVSVFLDLIDVVLC